ncbi:hypothetical protein [Sphingomicrobium sediminis]|uniref:Ribosomal protein L7/L12 C-terminal domain-containing protein n=1 Tax=Sphingomicrobium sediminis TaxID=2950949 RepID=A0A9X2J511_9SPHN|nr:hypothetical protein [Sphingomicrobium sediminis]MCM8557772.1 hypothetical protein [Sphingomicrobium sediminis]
MDGFFWVMLAGFMGFVLGRKSMENELLGKAEGPPREPGTLSDRARVAMEDAIRRGSTIEAIKIVRTDTGAGLKESKAFVDAFAAKRAEGRKGDPIS